MRLRWLQRLFQGGSASRTAMTDTDTWLIAGLGNPGRKYQHTRHNIGFMAVDRIGAHQGIAIDRNRFKNRFGRGQIGSTGVILAQPMDYMNRSGPPVYQLARYFNIDTANILVIHDDLDIDSQRIKIKTKGGHGGHRGVQSIIQALGTNEFARLRIGIGRPGPPGSPDEAPSRHGTKKDCDDPAITAHVLGTFSKKEWQDYDRLLDTAREAVETILEKGIVAAMNRFNG